MRNDSKVVELLRRQIADTLPRTRPERSNQLIQLICGFRPQEACCAELLPDAIFIDGTWENGRKNPLKTAGHGVEVLSIRRTPIINAILFLADCKPAPVPTRRGAAYFKRLATAALGKAGAHLDRYCLRDTALTWLTRDNSYTSRQVCDMCGHMNLRMLDDYYAFRKVKDLRDWKEAMPLNVAGIPKGWHGFLLETMMFIKWPGIKDRIFPVGDPAYDGVIRILRAAKAERPELDLF